MRTRTGKIRNLLAMAVTAVAVTACGGGGYGNDNAGPQPNVAPTISAIGDRSLDQDKTDSGVTFEVGDADGSAGALSLVVSSSDTGLLPTGNLVLGGSGTSRTLTVTPVENATGTATVTVTAMDTQGLSTSRSFRVTVNPVFVSFTRWITQTYAVTEDQSAIPLLGFTLDADADEVEEPFAALVQ